LTFVQRDSEPRTLSFVLKNLFLEIGVVSNNLIHSSYQSFSERIFAPFMIVVSLTL